MDDDEESTPLGPRSPKGGRPTLDVARRLSAHILDSAFAILVESGYGSLTMDMVADRANVSKKTVYSRFNGKDDLITSVVHHAMEKEVWASARAPATGPAKDRLFLALVAILKSTLKREVIAIENLFAVRPDLEQIPPMRAERLIPVQMVMDLLEEAKRAGQARYDDVSVIALIMLDAMVLGPRTRFLKMDDDERTAMSVDTNAKRIYDALWSGIAPARRD